MSWAMRTAAWTAIGYTAAFQRKVEGALEIMSDFFDRVQLGGYVAYSTGKDSQVVLDLAHQLRRPFMVIWHDEDWVLPGTIETLNDSEQLYQRTFTRVRERHAADEFFAQYGTFPHCSNPRSVDFEADTWAEIMQHYKLDGVALGMRKDESVARRMSLSINGNLRLGKKDQMWHVNPLANWKTDDVFAYLISRRLPLHPAYRAQIEAGVPLDRARVGPLTAVRVYEYGAMATLKRLYPDTWTAYVHDNPMCASET